MLEESIGERIKEDSILGPQKKLVSDRVVMFPEFFNKESLSSIFVLLHPFVVMNHDLYCYIFLNLIVTCSCFFI